MLNENLSFRSCLKHLFHFVRPYWLSFLVGLGMVVVSQVTFAINPIIEGQITTQIASDLSAGRSIQMDIIFSIVMTLMVIYIVKTISQYLTAIFLTRAIQNTMYDVRKEIQAKMQVLPVAYFDGHKAGDILSRITNDVDTLSNALQQTLSRVLSAVCTFIFVLFMMSRIHLIMTIVIICILPLMALFSSWIVKRSQPEFDAQQKSLANLNATVNELYDGYQEIMMYNQQKQAIDRFYQANESMRHTGMRAQFISSLISPLCSLITYITIGCLAFYGCILVIASSITIGQLQAFIRYIWQINDPISQVSQLSAQVQSSFSAMSRLFGFLRLDELKDEEDRRLIDSIESVDFEHVQFGYGDRLLMKNVNLHVSKGQTIAIVGKTGAGKTTMTNLLLRFYDIKNGSIKINGIDTRSMSYHDLRSLFGLVLQESWCFEGSIKENLLFANKDLTDEQMIKACKLAQIHETILSLPQGYDTIINEEASNFSQGEMQLLTIARALCKNPPILVLDEATSSVDTLLEKRLQKAIEESMKGRTSFVIAHRLSTIVNADLILVMDHGDIIEQGNHDQLLKKKGVYFGLYNAQFASNA